MARPERITSPHNPLLRELRRARDRGALTPDGCALAEGFHLLDEAMRSRLEVPVLLLAESSVHAIGFRLDELVSTRVLLLSDDLFASVSTTQTPQGVLAIVKPRQPESRSGVPLVVVLDSVQDPGNAGAIARAAEAFGASEILFLKETVSPWNPKTLRASAGSLFRLPLRCGATRLEAKAGLIAEGISVFATVPAGGTPLAKAPLDRPAAIVIGSEGAGIGEGWLPEAELLRIPTENVESLNAAMAASVILYEASRQRGFGS